MIGIVIVVIIGLLLFAVMGGAGFLYWAHLGSNKHESFIIGSSPNNLSESRTVSVVTFNIAGGLGSMYEGMDLHDDKYKRNNIDKIARFLRNENLDIVLLQEADFKLKQEHHLAEEAGYPYYACVTNWVKNYVPYPPWQISNHLRRVKYGQCILSKFPIVENRRIPLPQIEGKPFYYRAFYPEDAIQTATIKIGSKPLVVFNVHQEAFDKQRREKEIRILVDVIKNSPIPDVIVGGDFNALPPIAQLRKDYPELKGTPWFHLNHIDDNALEYFIGSLPDFVEAIPTTFDLDDNFTCPAKSPNKRLDYIFFPKSWNRLNSQILNPGLISDHLPVYVELKCSV
jgi:endonuclease/exonuclease/phosphatase family metal-dependent hydrolase